MFYMLPNRINYKAACWLLGGSFFTIGLIFMFKKPVWDCLSFVIWCIGPSEDGYTDVIKGWMRSATIIRKNVVF